MTTDLLKRFIPAAALTATFALSDAARGQTTPASPPSDWSALPALSIRCTHDDVMAYPRARCRFMVIGGGVWDLVSGKMVSGLEAKPKGEAPAAVADNGSVVAFALGGDKVATFAANDGHKLADMTLDGGGEPKLLAVTPQGLIAVAQGNKENHVSVFDVKTGKLLRGFDTAGTSLDHVDVSPTGEYVAIASNKGVSLFDTATGAPGPDFKGDDAAPARVRTPARPASRPATRPGRDARAVPPPAAPAARPARPMGFCDGVRFSPDGKQVAVWVRDPARVLLWEVGGGRPARVIPVPLTYGDTFGTRSGYRGPNIEFSPDASLIVLRGHWVFDARIGHLIAAVDGTLDLSGRHRLVSNEQFLVRESTGEFGSCRVKVLALPPRPTAAALAGPARLKPHDAVSVAFDGVTVRFGDQAAAQKEIRDTIAARYAFDGITVADGQPAVLHVTYTESAGKRRPVTKDYFQPTGQTVEDTKCAFTFTLTVGTDTVWSYAAKGSEVGFLRGEINETTVRNQAFKNALDAIHAVPFPYYVPADKGQLLPALFTLQKSRIGDD